MDGWMDGWMVKKNKPVQLSYASIIGFYNF